jgi:hypothetical protein
MNNKLILRTLTSPFDDVTKGYTLTHNDVDNNFLYLKGQSIYTASTLSNNLILNKINGDSLTIDLSSISGGGGGGNYLPLSGGTVTGPARFTNGLTGNTISATTYQNLPTDIRITGATYSNNTFTYRNNTGGTFNVLFNTVTGLTATTLNITTLGAGISVNNLGIDVNGNVVTGTAGGGVSITPYNNVGSATTISWNVSGVSTNYEVTLTGSSTLNLTNVRNGDYGTIIVKQDTAGSRTLSFGTVNGSAATHKVVNGGAGIVTLTSNASAIDILSFTYNGTFMFWTVGNDYN